MINFSKFVKESSYVLLQTLAQHFGNYEVYNEQCNYIPNIEDLNYMFSEFNGLCFENKLHKISFLCFTPHQLKQKFSQYNIKNIDEIADDYGAYVSRVPFYIENSTGEYVCDILDENIYLNMSLGKATILGIATIVCHEMAHEYDAWFGEYTELLLAEQLQDKEYDPHTTDTFKSLSRKISSQGLDIMQKTKNLSYQQVNSNIVKNARLLNEVDINSGKYTKISDNVYFARFSFNDISAQVPDLVTVGKVQVN